MIDAYFMGKKLAENVRIVEVDPDNHIITYICENLGDNKKFEDISVAVRDPEMDDEQAENLKNIAKHHLKEAEEAGASENPYNIDDNLIRINQG